MSNADKHKHLDLISQAIGRMAESSFRVRSWCVTVVSAVIALAVERSKPSLALAGLLPIVVFLLIDAYYLGQERRFRDMYDHVRQMSQDNIDFAMYYPDLPKRPLWAALPATIYLLLYGGLAAAVVVISLLL